MKIQIFSYLNETIKKTNGAIHYLERGIKSFGDDVFIIETKTPEDYFGRVKPKIIVLQGTFDDTVRSGKEIVCFRQKVKDYAYQENIPLLVLETNTASRILNTELTSFRKHHRVAFQHWLFNKGYFFEDDFDYSRWESFKVEHDLKVIPWRTEGENILLLLGFSQDPTNDIPPLKFCRESIDEIRKYSANPIIIRKHPLEILPEGFIDEFDGLDVSLDDNKSILQSIENAKVAIMYNSTSIFQIVYNGIPVIVGGNNFASKVASRSMSEVNNPVLFDQEEWFAKMRFTEWSREEMATSEFWERWRRNYYKYKEMINAS